MQAGLIENADWRRTQIEVLLEVLGDRSPRHARALEDAYSEVLAGIRAGTLEDWQWEVWLIEDLYRALERETSC